MGHLAEETKLSWKKTGTKAWSHQAGTGRGLFLQGEPQPNLSELQRQIRLLHVAYLSLLLAPSGSPSPAMQAQQGATAFWVKLLALKVCSA